MLYFGVESIIKSAPWTVVCADSLKSSAKMIEWGHICIY